LSLLIYSECIIVRVEIHHYKVSLKNSSCIQSILLKICLLNREHGLIWLNGRPRLINILTWLNSLALFKTEKVQRFLREPGFCF